MILKHMPGDIRFNMGDMAYTFLRSGDIYEFKNKDILINRFVGNLLDGSANNIWLRFYSDGEITEYPLLGGASMGTVQYSKSSLKYSGNIQGVTYSVTFLPGDTTWFWQVELLGEGALVDVVYGQDVGMASKGNLLSNELYVSQYLGHTVFENENGYTICSRQNIPQNEVFPYLQQGMIEGEAIGFSTDGMQFFGTDYKATGVPIALTTDLPNRNLQFECSYVALQSNKIKLEGHCQLTFYGMVQENHPSAIETLEFRKEIGREYECLFKKEKQYVSVPGIKKKEYFGRELASNMWGKAEIENRYSVRQLSEEENGEILSFFLPDHTHVVTQQKEKRTERPHGNIIISQLSREKVKDDIFTTTNYMYGMFNAQTVIGNTSKHKLLSASRGLLNVFKSNGQRIWVKIEGNYCLLTLPAVFEMGMNYSRWYYDISDDVLEITVFMIGNRNEIILEVISENSKSYEFIVTNQLVMGEYEFRQDIRLEQLENRLRIWPDESWKQQSPYPWLHYDMLIEGADYSWSDDAIFFEEKVSQNKTMLCCNIDSTSAFKMRICGSLLEPDITEPLQEIDFKIEKQKYLLFHEELMRGFNLKKDGCQEVKKLNHIMWWFAHNAMIHFAAPHGLEQTGGAAWGTRDVSQGPMEFFLSTQQYVLARNIILEIFSNQNENSGEWPQWFMFDKYTDVMSDCHGDVVFWPIKCLGDYIRSSGDYDILKCNIPYVDGGVANLMAHVKLAIETIKKRFVGNTFLISYAGGDWDDTLQPANEELKECMISGWTQALAFQVLKLLSEVLVKEDVTFASGIKEISVAMREDFLKYFVIDDVVAGFLCFLPNGELLPMLHPRDMETGINYRLLPMTRSIIAGLVDSEQARKNIDVIEDRLHFPDGVRLMDRPALYRGGVSYLFKRAEQAANVGREVSLQYTHAHIRYIEAMCHMGCENLAWNALFEVNPIQIKQVVPNANLRQSNLYFTSSEGAFYDRYEYGENFERLRTMDIDVKGGWRLYSSGPGIYFSQVVTGTLGIRFEGDNLIVDPVLPCKMGGLEFSYICFGKKVTFIYRFKENNSENVVLIKGNKVLPTKPVNNSYRYNGASLHKKHIKGNNSRIDVLLPNLQ